MSTRESIEMVKMVLDEEFAQMPKEDLIQGQNMNVYVRVRPLLKEEEESGFTECISVADDKTVQTVVPAESAKYKNMFYKPTERFTFSQAFSPNENQFNVFENTMKDIIQSFVDGANSLVFTYGSSGSGKTYTMQGINSEPGIIPLTVQLVFELVKDKITLSPVVKPQRVFDIVKLTPAEVNKELIIRDELLQITDNESGDSCRSDKLGCLSMSNIFSEDVTDFSFQEDISNIQQMRDLGQVNMKNQNNSHYSVWVSFIEIYNEKIYDLLQPMMKKRKCLSLGEDKQGSVFVKGAKEVFVNSCEEIFKLLRVGRRNLKIASTKLNYQSSRSHCIFNIKVIRVNNLENCSSARVNVLSFCDLAGSERSCKTNNTGVRLKEAGNINTSLLVLGRCVEALRQNQFSKEKKIVPFRDSKLTHLFSCFFSGKGKASMIINVSPSSYTFDESLHALKFSALAKEVTMIEDQWSTKLRRLSHDHSKTMQLGKTSTATVNDSMDENGFYGEIMAMEQEKEELIQELVDHARTLEADLNTVQEEKRYLEDTLRAELSRYFKQMYEKRIASLKGSYNKLYTMCQEQSDKRIKCLIESLAKKDESGSESEEEEDDDLEDGNDNEKENKIAELKNKLDEEVKSKNSEIEKLQSKINEYAGLLKLQEQDSKNKEKTSKETLTKKDEQIKELEKKIEELQSSSALQKKEAEKASTDESVKHLAAKDDEIRALTATIEKFKSSTAQLEEKLSQKEADIAKSTSEMSKKCVEVENFMETIGTLEKEYNTMAEKLSKKDAANEKINAEVSKKTADLEKMSKELETLKTNFGTLEEQAKSKDSALEENSLQVSMKDIELTKLKRENGEFQHKLAATEKSLEEVQQDYLSMSTDYNKAIENLKEVESALQQKENKHADGLANVKMEIIQVTEPVSKENKAVLVREDEDVTRQNVINSICDMSSEELSEILEQKPVLKKKVSDVLCLPVIEEQMSEVKTISIKLEEDMSTLSQSNSEKETTIQKLHEDIQSLTNGYTLDVSKLRTTIESQESLIKTKDKESLKYRDETKSLKKSVEDLATTEKGLKKEVQELKKSVDTKTQQAETQKKEFSKLEAGLKEEINQLKKNLESKQQLLDNKEKDFKKASESLTEKLSKLRKDLEQKESALESQNDGSKKVTEFLKEEVSELKRLVASKEGTIESMEKEHNTLIKEKTETISELSNVLNCKDQLIKSQENGLNKVIEDLNEKVKQLEAEKTGLINTQAEELKKVSNLSEEIANLKKALAAKEKGLNSQEKEHEQVAKELKEKVKTLEETLKSKDQLIHTQCEDSKKMVDSLTQEISNLKKSLDVKASEAKSKDQDLNSTVEDQQKRISELEETISSKESVINQQIEDSKRMADDLNDKIAQLMSDVNKKELVIQLHDKDSKKLADENKKEIDKLKKDMASKERLLESHNKDSGKVTDSLNKKIEKLEKSISLKEDTISTQKEESNEKIEKLENELSHLKKNLESKNALIQSLEESNEKIEKLENELSHLKKNLESKNALIQSLEASRASAISVEEDATDGSSAQESDEGSLEEKASEEPEVPTSPIKQRPVATKATRGRKPRAMTVSSIPSPIRRPKAESSPSVLSNVQKVKERVVATPPTPVVKKLRTRTAKIDYKAEESPPTPSKRKKPSPPEEAETPQPQSRLSRQKPSRPFRGAAATSKASSSDKPVVEDKPVESVAVKAVKTKAPALAYLSPKKAPAAKPTLAARRKRTLYDNTAAQSTANEASPAVPAKSPAATSKKTSKEVPRPVNKRKLRQ